jgi:hypothetical protein
METFVHEDEAAGAGEAIQDHLPQLHVVDPVRPER